MKRLKVELDFGLRLSITEQLVAQISALILKKRLKAGDQLPTVRHLADELAINFNTVARVYRILAEKRLISVQHGRGTFVLPQSARQEKDLQDEILPQLARQYLLQTAELGISNEKARRAITLAKKELESQEGDVSRETIPEE